MGNTNQIQVILNKISLEGLERQCPIPHGHHKRMVNESIPYGCDIWPLQHPIYKATTAESITISAKKKKNMWRREAVVGPSKKYRTQ